MKKIHLCLLCMITLLCLSGCSNNKELEEKIKELENKVEKLETNKSITTKEELVGVWENSSGKTLTFNEDGSWISSTTDNTYYFAYSIIGNNIMVCSSSKFITTCLNPSEYMITIKYYPVYEDNNLIIVDNDLTVFTKKQ